MKHVYVAMPKFLKRKNHQLIVNKVKKSFLERHLEYKGHHFLNPFNEIEQIGTPEDIMKECFKAVKKADAVLCIIPMPPEIDETLTLGALSESDLALIENKPVHVCELKKRKAIFFTIKHLNELLKKYKVKAPLWWLEKHPDLRIGKKYISQENLF